MYSRNTSKNGHFSHRNPPVKQHRNNTAVNTEPDRTNGNVMPSPPNNNYNPQNDVTPAPQTTRPPVEPRPAPSVPPNYRGMIYEMEQITDPELAEGIDRLVRNDASYNNYERQLRRRDYKEGRVGADAPVFSHRNREWCSCKEREEKTPERNGLQGIIDGLREKRLLPEDILICALIILMLNSSSEDDIIMILALMMLL
ncbi:MAG: hypothetical protein E7574_00190 [Ruminococcaceae bacterium]|nr:hypothetical protein [Oscillospiraceae bacterium]